ncbi:BCS1 N terminal-domain-containing protein [Infundibulicybe gibba]|nr:BCS1 N terminal-domain-containing protein [Infundibulicybe gibba]
MASYLPMVQHVLSGIANEAAPNITAVNGTAAATDIAPISSLITLLFSSTALRDWVKLIIIGGFFETCRRWASTLYYKFVEAFYLQASFDENDPSYNWMLVWLSKQPSWGKSRNVQITTASHGSDSPAIVLASDDENSSGSFFKSAKSISYLPSLSTTYTMWYRRRWMTVTRTQQQGNTGYYGGPPDSTLTISILSRDHTVLTDLLREARRDFMASQQHSMCVYTSDVNNSWRHVACRAKRSMNSIVLDPGIKDLLLDDAKDFLRSKSWYSERGIPFRRGYLLYGAPGSGKTSMIHCMAGELGLDVYVVSLSRIGLDDTGLGELINELPERCIALMEDIDAAFTHSLNRDTADADRAPNAKNGPPGSAPSGGPPSPPSTSRLSLSGLLNALDGVGAQEGRILFATTNKYSALDAALCRPGRMDIHVEFKLASRYQAQLLFARFYLPNDALASTGDKDGEAEGDNEKADEDDDSGYASSLDAKTDSSADVPVSEKPAFSGDTHKIGDGPRLSRARIEALAIRFAAAIPERECSMASLQGYLMLYKTRPYLAVREVAAWVEKERKARIEKEMGERARKEKEEKEAKEKVEKEAKEKAEKEAKEKAEKEAKEKETEKEKAATPIAAPKADEPAEAPTPITRVVDAPPPPLDAASS